jgi:alkanesulfonate monooxygenase SsuD/methylene tetrahydromethanopterin reductase-like flavin-dependent oxidoreductase (luciferase family)
MLEPQLGMSVDDLVRAAEKTEELGFGYLFRSDHLLPTDNRRGIDSPECWTSLGVVAARTHRVKFGPMVTPAGFRNPALLAKMACTLHSFTKGRLQLALGAGWYEPEYTAFGYAFPSFPTRRTQFMEALSIILSLVREGRVDFDGKFYSAHTDCLPRPSGPLHVIIGARAKSLVRIAARQADEWNSLASTPEFFAQRKSMIENLVGRDKVQMSEMGPFLIGRNRSEVEANARLQVKKLGQNATPEDVMKRIRARGGLCGTPDEFMEMLNRKRDSGVEKFYFQTLVPENTAMTELLADTLKSRF